MKFLFILALSALNVNAYWLMAIEDFITTERIDPVVSMNKMAVSAHAHSVFGGSNFRFNTTTASLRQSQCTSVPIPQDKSSYWLPHLYFQWGNTSFTSVDGAPVVDTPGTTTAFPDDFRMISGDPSLRTYTATSAQKAVTFLCLNFNGVSQTYNSLPPTSCPNGIRAQINFPSCWDGKNLDSVDHKSHVAFLSGGPDSGTCSDPKFPVVLPRIFIEVYWSSNVFDGYRSQALNSTQPFVFSYGDPVGYGYHADFINGWDAGVLQKAVDNCHCNEYGDPTCCAEQEIFDLNQGLECHITKSIDEQTTGTLLRLPGTNPVQPEGKTAITYVDNVQPPLISPVYVYTGTSPSTTGKIVARQTVSTQTPSLPTISLSTLSSTSVGTSTPSLPPISVPTLSSSTITGTLSIQTLSLPTTISAPTLSSTHLPVASLAAAIPVSSLSSGSEPVETSKRRQLGLDYHRHHRRLSHLPRYDFSHDKH